jgi:hypothetical protein
LGDSECGGTTGSFDWSYAGFRFIILCHVMRVYHINVWGKKNHWKIGTVLHSVCCEQSEACGSLFESVFVAFESAVDDSEKVSPTWERDLLEMINALSTEIEDVVVND